MSRTKVIVISVFIGLVILGVAVEWCISARYRKACQRELALLVAEGGSRNILDMVPKPLGNLPDKPVKLLYADDFAVSRRATTFPRMTIAGDDPELTDAEELDSTFYEFSNWARPSSVIWDAKARRPKPFNEDWLPSLERLISFNGVLLDRVRTTASNGNAMFYIDWTQGVDSWTPHLMDVREDASLLRADAYIRLRKGDTAGAIADVRTMLHLRDTLDHDPTTISKCEAFEVDRISLGALDMVVEEGHPDRESVADILKELEGREARNRLTGVLLGETAMDLDTVDVVAKHPDTFIYYSAPVPAAQSGQIRQRARSSWRQEDLPSTQRGGGARTSTTCCGRCA